MASTTGGSDTSILTVDTNSGSVARRKMYQVASSRPPTSTEGYPEGFVWYRDTDDAPAPDGSKVPIGGIIMWSGAINNIPFGYRLCDGGGGTPDLRGRFIVGAGPSYVVGDTGGANQVGLGVNNLPPHDHGIGLNRDYATSEYSAGSVLVTQLYFTANNVPGTFANGRSWQTGSGVAHENRPPYYALAYIMRIA